MFENLLFTFAPNDPSIEVTAELETATSAFTSTNKPTRINTFAFKKVLCIALLIPGEETVRLETAVVAGIFGSSVVAGGKGCSELIVVALDNLAAAAESTSYDLEAAELESFKGFMKHAQKASLPLPFIAFISA